MLSARRSLSEFFDGGFGEHDISRQVELAEHVCLAGIILLSFGE